MKAVLIYALAAVALADELDGIYRKSNHAAGLHDEQEYGKDLLPPIRNDQICEPWSVKKKYCNDCFCFADGSGWVCSSSNCPQTSDSQLNPNANSINRLNQDNRLLLSKRGLRGQSNRAVELHVRNPYKHLLRSRRSNQICTPGFAKKIGCKKCICAADGSRWFCGIKKCLQALAGRTIPNVLITHADQEKKLGRSKREKECAKDGDKRKTDCFTCYCDSNGFYSVCFSQSWCDPYNFRD